MRDKSSRPALLVSTPVPSFTTILFCFFLGICNCAALHRARGLARLFRGARKRHSAFALGERERTRRQRVHRLGDIERDRDGGRKTARGGLYDQSSRGRRTPSAGRGVALDDRGHALKAKDKAARFYPRRDKKAVLAAETLDIPAGTVTLLLKRRATCPNPRCSASRR